MLIRKLFRTAWRYKSQFLSMILMIAIGVGVFLGFNIEWKSIEADTTAFFEETDYADFRLYEETGFSEEDIEKIQEIDGVEAATRYLAVNAECQFQIAPFSSLHFSISIGPFRCSRCCLQEF